MSDKLKPEDWLPTADELDELLEELPIITNKEFDRLKAIEKAAKKVCDNYYANRDKYGDKALAVWIEVSMDALKRAVEEEK